MATNERLLRLGNAQAFWGSPHQLKTWFPGLSIPKSPQQARLKRLEPDALRLWKFLTQATRAGGGATWAEMERRAIEAEWTSERLIAALRSLTGQQLIIEHRGLFLKNPTLYS
jgi:hypothetical protein